jgi:hypothetical protein
VDGPANEPPWAANEGGRSRLTCVRVELMIVVVRRWWWPVGAPGVGRYVVRPESIADKHE